MMRRGPLDRYSPEWVLRQANAHQAEGSIEFHTDRPVTLYLQGGCAYAAEEGVNVLEQEAVVRHEASTASVTLDADAWAVIVSLAGAAGANELRNHLGWTPDRLAAALAGLDAAGVLKPTSSWRPPPDPDHRSRCRCRAPRRTADAGTRRRLQVAATTRPPPALDHRFLIVARRSGMIGGRDPGGDVLLRDRTVLVTGVLTPSSIAHTCARVAQEQGATVILTSFGRATSTTRRAARKLPVKPEVLELDVTDQAHLDALAPQIADRWGELHGVVHAVGFAPAACLGQDDGLFAASWEEVATALQVSAWSLPALAKAVRPVLARGGSIVGLDFDASVAWPAYDWMGVAKAALESASRYLARDLGPEGIRVNLVAAGPLRTVAARSIPGFSQIDSVWQERAPLGWDVDDPEPAARAVVALLSDWFTATTGEIVHVDGGVHAIGAAGPPNPSGSPS